jgi:L-arabinose isomerase
MTDSVHGWFKPPVGVREFLKAYSEAGGTHHLAVSYGESVEKLVSFGRMMGFQTQVIA